MIDTIIFDLDGTIFETRDSIIKTFNYTLSKHGYSEESPDRIRELIGTPLEEMFVILTGKEDEADPLSATYRERYAKSCVEHSFLYPGVIETLELLSGFKLGIATTKRAYLAKQLCEAFELSNYFSVILGSEDVQNQKPAPDIVLKAVELTESKPENAIMVGDTKFDILSGNAAGTKTCGVTYGIGSEAELREAGADFIIDSFPRIIQVVEELK